MTDERRVEVAAEAILASELLGCGCCATSTPTPTCACGRTEADLDWTSCPSCGQYPQDEARSDIIARAVVAALDAHDGDLRAELNNLRRWKREALEVAAAWEQVWVELGQPGPLGASKAEASRVAVDALRRQYEADLDRVTYLRASAAVAERDEARAALARVGVLRQPHTTTGGLTYCTAFRCCDPSGIPSEWPCDTRRAITGEEPSS